MISIKTNFSFLKAFNKMEEIEKGVIGELSEIVVESAAKTINSGKLKPLSPFTIKSRKRGRGWGGVKVPPTNDITPLRHTGTLVKSLKVVRNGFQMADYGFRHQQGKGVPKREFLPFTKDMGRYTPEVKILHEKVTNRYTERIRKAMKK